MDIGQHIHDDRRIMSLMGDNVTEFKDKNIRAWIVPARDADHAQTGEFKLVWDDWVANEWDETFETRELATLRLSELIVCVTNDTGLSDLGDFVACAGRWWEPANTDQKY